MKVEVREPLRGLEAEQAFGRWRDELALRAAGIPHVKQLFERERGHHGDGRLRRVIEWALDVEVPLLARPFVPRDALVLELEEFFEEPSLGCEWTLRSRGVAECAACARGTLRFAEDPAAGCSLLTVAGDVAVDLCQVPQLPNALARSTTPALEKAVAGAMERTWRRLAASLQG